MYIGVKHTYYLWMIDKMKYCARRTYILTDCIWNALLHCEQKPTATFDEKTAFYIHKFHNCNSFCDYFFFLISFYVCFCLPFSISRKWLYGECNKIARVLVQLTASCCATESPVVYLTNHIIAENYYEVKMLMIWCLWQICDACIIPVKCTR